MTNWDHIMTINFDDFEVKVLVHAIECPSLCSTNKYCCLFYIATHAECQSTKQFEDGAGTIEWSL